jgi:hypothetical protein
MSAIRIYYVEPALEGRLIGTDEGDPLSIG